MTTTTRTDRALYVEVPTEYTGTAPAVFLAGGISGCPNWQADAYRQLADLPVAVCNPRCTNFPIHDPGAARTQIEWEHRHLHAADVVLFWFPAAGSITQPIALYELGAHSAGGRPIAVGADSGYIRYADVVIQTGLARPDVPVRVSLADVVADVRRLLEAR